MPRKSKRKRNETTNGHEYRNRLEQENLKNLKNLVEIPEYNLKISNPSFHQYIIKVKKV